MAAIKARIAERCGPSCTLNDPDGNGQITLTGVQILDHGGPGYLVEQRGGSGGDWYGVLVRRPDGWHHIYTAELAMGVQVLKTSHGGYRDLAVFTKAYTTGGRRAIRHRGVVYRAWERGLSEPAARNYPKVIEFLGREPWPVPVSLRERFRAARLRRGLMIREAAALAGIYPTLLGQFERHNARAWSRSIRERVEAFIAADTIDRPTAPAYPMASWQRRFSRSAAGPT